MLLIAAVWWNLLLIALLVGWLIVVVIFHGLVVLAVFAFNLLFIHFHRRGYYRKFVVFVNQTEMGFVCWSRRLLRYFNFFFLWPEFLFRICNGFFVILLHLLFWRYERFAGGI